MEQLPAYINIVFILTTLLAVLMLYKAAHSSKVVMLVILFWLILQSVISRSGFYLITNAIPPRFMLLVLPPMLLVIGLFFTRAGRRFADSLDAKMLTLLHIVRISVELTLYWLFLHKAIPGMMTFEGRNFDILCGLTAPFIYYFGYIKKQLNTKVFLAWNIICLLLLANVVTIAMLSAPLPFQRFAFSQPNVAILYFPFVWLPGCLVPIVLFAHLVLIRRLVKK